jgi:hypothetical protein
MGGVVAADTDGNGESSLFSVSPGSFSSDPGSDSSSSTKSESKFAHAPTPNAITASYAKEVPFHGDTF